MRRPGAAKELELPVIGYPDSGTNRCSTIMSRTVRSVVRPNSI